MTEPHRIHLRNGITTVNAITGETAPTYGEYVLASDYDSLSAREAQMRAAAKQVVKLSAARALKSDFDIAIATLEHALNEKPT